MLLNTKTNNSYTARQLKLPLEIEKIIDISDPVYTFCEVMDHIDLSGYFVEKKGCKTGRPRCDAEKLLKVILFAFMEQGFCSLRELEKLCRTDIRYMYLLDETAICDEYIAAVDAKPYASDMECFVPLMEKFMKFTMFEKETKDDKYHNNPYRISNFRQDESGNLICPSGRRFIYKYDRHVKGNRYGRTEEIYECEDCTGCPYKDDCCRKASGNRTARLNRELTAIHREVIDNLESIHGALLRMNRSIQAEGTFGTIKWNRTYKRLFRRGEKAVLLESNVGKCLISTLFFYSRFFLRKVW